MKRIVLLFLLFFSFVFSASAHPGNTDSKGGHYDRSTGVYHYHHGYSAHFHTNGVCPYDFDDKTGSRSGGPSDGSGNRSYSRVTSPSDLNLANSTFAGTVSGIAAAAILRCIIKTRA